MCYLQQLKEAFEDELERELESQRNAFRKQKELILQVHFFHLFTSEGFVFAALTSSKFWFRHEIKLWERVIKIITGIVVSHKLFVCLFVRRCDIKISLIFLRSMG